MNDQEQMHLDNIFLNEIAEKDETAEIAARYRARYERAVAVAYLLLEGGAGTSSAECKLFGKHFPVVPDALHRRSWAYRALMLMEARGITNSAMQDALEQIFLDPQEPSPEVEAFVEGNDLY